jgi:cystine transport system substrate-binding protein
LRASVTVPRVFLAGLVMMMMTVVACGGSSGGGGGSSSASGGKPAGADKTKLSDWSDPRPAAWKSKYPLFGPVAIGDGSLKKVQDASTLKICANNQTFPYNYLDPKTGKTAGLEPDMLNYMKQQLGISNVSYVYVDWQALIPALQANRCDAIMNGLVMRTDRASAGGVKFTTPYFIVFDEMVTRSDSPVQSIDDLKGQKICTVAGSTDDLTLRAILTQKGLSNVQVVDFQSSDECFLATQNKTVQAGWYDQGSVGGALKQYTSLHVVGSPQTYVPTGKFANELSGNPFKFGSIGAVTHDSAGDLNLALSIVVNQMVKNGQQKTIAEKWGIWNPEEADMVRPDA